MGKERCFEMCELLRTSAGRGVSVPGCGRYLHREWEKEGKGLAPEIRLSTAAPPWSFLEPKGDLCYSLPCRSI